MPLVTFADAFDSVLAYSGGQPDDRTIRDVKQSIAEALLELANAHTWSYLYKPGRLNLNAPFVTGTIQYQVSSGAVPYQMTLSGGTWPAWAADGYIQINLVVYRVDKIISPTVVTIVPDQASPVDIAPGTVYGLYQDSYLLPADFIAQDQPLYQTVFGGLEFVRPADWMFTHRYRLSSGTPRTYTIMGDVKYPGKLTAKFSPSPSSAWTIDYIYKRRPSPLSLLNYKTGTVTLDGTSSVVGTGTAFTSSMVGSVFRLSGNSSTPTWMPGGNPPVYEGVVQSVQSATALTLLSPSGQAATGAQYAISDMVDIESGSMLNAFLRCCEMKLGQHRIMKDKPSAKAQYLDELRRAKEADSRSFSGRSAGPPDPSYLRLRDMPSGPDQM